VAVVDPWSSALVEAAARIAPYVAHVVSVNAKENRAAVGSGFAIDAYHVITHAPFAAADSEITVQVGGRKLGARAVGTDPLYFLAVLRCDARIGLPPVPYEDSQAMRPGQMVLALGDPYGTEHEVTHGIITAVDRTIYRPERFPVDGLIVTDAVLHAGNVGGPLATLEGRVVGLNGLPFSNGLGLAVQADVVMRIANQIIEFGSATHPWLGFSGQAELIDPAIVSLFGLPVSRGVVVNHVVEGGPGERAGVRAFDMVVRVDGKPVTHLGFIRRVLASRRAGDKGTLTVVRDGSLIDLTIPVEEIPRLAQA
jgi:serine protease Do